LRVHKATTLNGTVDSVDKYLKDSKQQDRKRQYLINNLELRVSQIRLELNELQDKALRFNH